MNKTWSIQPFDNDTPTPTRKLEEERYAYCISVSYKYACCISLMLQAEQTGAWQHNWILTEFITILHHGRCGDVESFASSGRHGNLHFTKDAWHVHMVLFFSRDEASPHFHFNKWKYHSVWCPCYYYRGNISTRNAPLISLLPSAMSAPGSPISNYRSRKAQATFLDILS